MISSTATYALRAVVFLANRPDDYVCREAISAATQVPHDYLLKVLNKLDAAGIVESRRGRTGGYRLRHPPEETTALDVVLAVDTIPRISKCPLGISEHEQLCPLHQLLDNASRAVEDAFRQTTIAALVPRKREQKCGFPNETQLT